MFLKLFVEIILLTIIFGGSYYGYKKGFFALAVKPVKALLRLGTSVFFCVPLGELLISPIISPIIKKKIPVFLSTYIENVVSAGISFLIILVCSGFIFSLVSSLLDSCVSVGILGRINALFGLAFAAVCSIILAWIFVALTDIALALDFFADSRFVMEFDGGLFYKILKYTSPLGL